MKRVAAIDFGSNAIRLTIADVVSMGKYKIVEKFRFPVRIGSDVFTNGEISSSKQDEIYEVFRKFRSHIRYYHAEEIEAVGTSALRDAKNSSAVIMNIEEVSGIKVRLISGKEEAGLISKILSQELPILNGTALLVDIGGGSTELIFLKAGEVVKLESFNNGSLRPVNEGEKILVQMKAFVQANLPVGEKITIIGTGGNLRRLGKLRKKIFDAGSGGVIKKNEVTYIYNELKDLTPAQAVAKFDLKLDRAEVITPALKIFSALVDEVDPETIYLPKIGLSDSLLNKLSTAV
ncbi:MAG: hypothetical protein H7336_14920 [Bacteriovorax sp.]|nr:hypothetical protein [Bacteriovorax sp.]